MLQWFSSLRVVEQIFVWIAAPASLILVIQTVMLFFGGAEAGVDADVSGLDGVNVGDVVGSDMSDIHGEMLDVSTSAGLQFVTMRGIIALLTVFGWTGLCSMLAGMEDTPAIALAAVLGIGAMVGIAYLVRGILSLQTVDTVGFREALGQSANVYLTIPPNGEGTGKITLTLCGALREYDAVTSEASAIKTGEVVRVTDILYESVAVVERDT